ncbi:hypothetical protein E8K88_17375 [Lampropedia aestuarii]|uniref:Serine/threonine protein kinase n=1 Tax=Lampropedia aestuarii TaxID=2562762 RepID=A0A4S5BIM4_9BURK|nr:hypothetical protein [Lampropedia aestuarii]THJ30703.1 hypothetical protein E8K88_17375 [Lampropedia aestuarii]
MDHHYRSATAFKQFDSPAIEFGQAASPAINWQDFLLQRLPHQENGIQDYELPNWPGRVWLKRARPKRSALLYAMLNKTAGLLRLPWLKASSSALGGTFSSAVELRRLQELAQAGIRVPHVLAHTVGAILMQDAVVGVGRSESLQHRIESHFANGQPEAALGYWQQGLYALSEVHHKGQYLSQAFSRNIVISSEGEIGFVDFEDDPLEVMDLPDCKVRDLFCYLHSTAWPIAQAGVVPQAQAILSQWIVQYGEAERQAFRQATQRVRYLRLLPTKRRYGKDVVRIRFSYALLSNAIGR